MTSHTECEFKLRATRAIEVAQVDATLHELGARCRLAEQRRHVDVYLDDAEGSLRAAGIGLRLRRGERDQELTSKAPAHRDGALFVREECSGPWTDDAPPSRASQLPEPLRHRVEPFVLDRPLGPVMRLAIRRELRHLEQEGTEQCELAIDLVEAHANGRSIAFQEVELEVIGDLGASEHLTEQLRRRLPLAHADRDKPSHAAALLGLERAATNAGAEHDGTPIGAALRQRFAAALAASATAEVIARDGRDAEGVHAMRVATRRVRTLLRAFAPLWPETVGKRLTTHFRETGRRLGAVRDLDVLLQSLPGDVGELPQPLAAAGGRALELLRRARDAQRAQLTAWLCRADRLAEASWCAGALLQPAESPESMAPVGIAARTRLAEAAAELHKELRSLPPELPLREAHRVRLMAKRTRYLVEEFAPKVAPEDDRCLKRLTRVQRALGEVCDHEAAVGWLLAALPASEASPEGRALAAALGGLATGRARAARRARKRARRALDRLDSKKVWKQLSGPRAHDAKLTD